MTREQIEILDHTLHRTARGYFCGDSPAMQALVAVGYMALAGKPSWCPDPYFRITAAGREAWREWHDSQHKPLPLPACKRRSRERYRRWLNSGAGDCGVPFGEWLKSEACV